MGVSGNVLDLLIAMECKSALLYGFFQRQFPQDAPFWWQLVQEEEQHVILLHAQRKALTRIQPVDAMLVSMECSFPQTIRVIEKFIPDKGSDPFTRRTALTTALQLESLCDCPEILQQIEMDSDTETITVFHWLCGEEHHHSRRIEDYMSRIGLA